MTSTATWTKAVGTGSNELMNNLVLGGTLKFHSCTELYGTLKTENPAARQVGAEMVELYIVLAGPVA